VCCQTIRKVVKVNAGGGSEIAVRHRNLRAWQIVAAERGIGLQWKWRRSTCP
jgi:hypothetical protein